MIVDERYSKAIKLWQSRYNLEEYEITVDDLDTEHAATTTVDPMYLRAHISLNVEELEEDEWLDRTIAHEFAHILLGEIAHWAADTIEATHEKNARNEAWHFVWERATERVARLMRSLYDGRHATEEDVRRLSGEQE